ncbi:hypothetical protein FHR32_005466 [Streptosporangium album]|uniref:Histidine kinase n=1 Tax=Streptosporangium album TaxID=47479 RepID=A0A7W7RZG2_9ACTN|nr:sensor domain-containing protein [Streptosporangium album]MBB4941089.1 hypothetical protein [Streptosporangium album]
MTRIRRALKHGLVSAGELSLNAATGVAALLLTATVLAGVALVPVAGIGLPPLARLLTPVRSFARFQRARVSRALGRAIAEPYSSPAGPRIRAHLIPALRDPATWRDLLWLAVHGVTSAAFGIAVWAMLSAVGAIWTLRTVDTGRMVTFTLSLSILLIILAAVPLFRTGQARMAHLLLRPTSSPARRIRELTESRAAALDAQAAELRRIERDLHDGAQARLISVRMNLGLARGSHDLAQVQELVEEAWGPPARPWPSCGTSCAASIRRCSPTGGWPGRSRPPRCSARSRSRSESTCRAAPRHRSSPPCTSRRVRP